MANRYLNNITINDAYTLPSTDGTNGQAIITDGAGNLSFSTITDGEAVKIQVKNTSGSTITKGTPVYITGTVGASFTAEVAPADASNAAKMPSTGLLETDLAHNDIGYAVTAGLLKNILTDPIDTVTPSINQTIYVKAGGGLTTTKPTGTNLIQNVGKIGRVSAANAGSVIVSSILRSNDVPNIPPNNIWLGNSSSVPTATAHTVENISNVTVSSKTDGQALVWDAANNYWKNGTVSGGGGGGGGVLSIERDVFTATALQTAFTISSEITASSNTQVYIDGVYQAKSNYTTSGSTITFSTGVPAGAEVEVVHFISVLSKIYTDTFTGDASTVNFTASKDVTDENVTQVYIDGVYQSKDNYTTSGTTITFSTAPPSGSAIEVVHFTPAVYSTLNSNQFTGTGSQTDFTLTQAVDADKSFVFIQGMYQEKSTYSISGTTLTFTTAPLSGYSIEVITVGAVSVFNDTIYLDNFSGTGSQVDYTLSASPSSENAIDVYINGLYQQKDTFSLSGSTLTFSTAPPNGSTIEVKSTAGLNNVTVNSTMNADSFTANGTTTDYTLSITPSSLDSVDVFLNGIYQNQSNLSLTGNVLTFSTAPVNGTAIEIKSIGGLNNVTARNNDVVIVSSNTTAVKNTLYVLTANVTLTLPASPTNGDSIKVSNRSGVATCVIARNGENIMGAAADLTIDKLNSGFELIYAGSTQGWVLIGVPGQ